MMLKNFNPQPCIIAAFTALTVLVSYGLHQGREVTIQKHDTYIHFGAPTRVDDAKNASTDSYH